VRRIRTGFPTILGVIFLASACSTGTKPVAPPPASAPPPTPTPGVLSRTDPTVVEETETYVIRRLAKEQYVKVDDRHIRHDGGDSFSASIVDTTLFIVNNHETLRQAGASLVLYLPKIQTAEEAALWNDILAALETQLGPTWPDGAEVSFGQWQKFALARGFMRDEPLLLILDEPTAALDAETEHALFERYAAAVRGSNGNGHAENTHPASHGRITLLVSHRFSTVRMADLIVVLDGSKLVEFGSHEELIANGAQYSQLYNIQANAYR